MSLYKLKFTLLSDATFGRGDGVAGLVDSEIQHDSFGLPYLSGRTLRGLLNAECADILFSLELQGKEADWLNPAQRLFGRPGSKNDNTALLHVGDACLPQDLRDAVKIAIELTTLQRQNILTRQDILASLTSIRRQTAIDEQTGAPRKESLRTMRVILRETQFEADFYFGAAPSPHDLALLAACVKALRRAGLGRSRGKGELQAQLCDVTGTDITQLHFDFFKKAVQL